MSHIVTLGASLFGKRGDKDQSSQLTRHYHCMIWNLSQHLIRLTGFTGSD